jgi:hypothetical protein
MRPKGAWQVPCAVPGGDRAPDSGAVTNELRLAER